MSWFVRWFPRAGKTRSGSSKNLGGKMKGSRPTWRHLAWGEIMRAAVVTHTSFKQEESKLLTEGEKKADRGQGQTFQKAGAKVSQQEGTSSRWHLKEVQAGKEPGFLFVFTFAPSRCLWLLFALEVESRIHPFMCSFLKSYWELKASDISSCVNLTSVAWLMGATVSSSAKWKESYIFMHFYFLPF